MSKYFYLFLKWNQTVITKFIAYKLKYILFLLIKG